MLVRWILKQNPEFSEGSFLSDSPLETSSTVQVGRILNGCDRVAMLGHIRPRVGIVVTWLLNECCKGSNVPNMSNILLLICSHSMASVLPPRHSSCAQFSLPTRTECRQVTPCRVSSALGTKVGTISETFFKLRALSFCFCPKGRDWPPLEAR